MTAHAPMAPLDPPVSKEILENRLARAIRADELTSRSKLDWGLQAPAARANLEFWYPPISAPSEPKDPPLSSPCPITSNCIQEDQGELNEFLGPAEVSQTQVPQGGGREQHPPPVERPCPIISDCVKVEQGTQTGEIILDLNYRSIETQTEGEGRCRDQCTQTSPEAEQGGGEEQNPPPTGRPWPIISECVQVEQETQIGDIILGR